MQIYNVCHNLTDPVFGILFYRARRLTQYIRLYRFCQEYFKKVKISSPPLQIHPIILSFYIAFKEHNTAQRRRKST